MRDALTMGPSDHEDEITPHTRPPADDDAEHVLVRTVECLEGSVEVELVCEPVFDYGRAAAAWALVDGDRHAADAQGPDRRSGCTPTSRSASKATGSGLGTCSSPASRAYCALSWARRAGRSEGRRGGGGAARGDDPLLACLAAAGADPGSPLARPDPALRARDQGPDLHADRRHRRRLDDLAARDARAASATGTTATPGSATARSRSRRCTGSTSTGRPTSTCSSSPTSSRPRTARSRSCTGSTAGAT